MPSYIKHMDKMHKISVISNSSLSQLSFGISFILKNFILKNWKFQCLMWNCPHSEVFPSCIVLTVSLDLTLAVLVLGMEFLLYLECWCKVTSWFGLTSWCQIKKKLDDQAMAVLIYIFYFWLSFVCFFFPSLLQNLWRGNGVGC